MPGGSQPCPAEPGLDGECQHETAQDCPWGGGELWEKLLKGRDGLSSLLLAKLAELPLSHIFIYIISPMANLFWLVFGFF